MKTGRLPDDVSPERGRVQVARPGVYNKSLSLIELAARFLGGISSSGVQNLPAEQSFIVAANHVSVFDPPLLAAAVREATGDSVHFLANAELWQDSIGVADKRVNLRYIGPMLRPLLDSCGAIPITRNRPISAETYTHLGGIVAGSGIIGIFPQGGLVHDREVKGIHLGAGMLASTYGLDVVPAGIAGSDPSKTADGSRDFGDFHIHFGEPIPAPQEHNTVRVSKRITPEIEIGIQNALDMAYSIRK